MDGMEPHHARRHGDGARRPPPAPGDDPRPGVRPRGRALTAGLGTALALLLSAPGAAQGEGPPPMRKIDTADSPHGVGVGVVAGDPTGLSIIWRADDTNAVQLGAGWSFRRADLDVALDYQVTLARARIGDVRDAHFNAYAGVGGELDLLSGRDDDSWHVGLRLPLGVAFLPDRHPFDLFLQITPVLVVLPTTEVVVDGGLGGRIFF